MPGSRHPPIHDARVTAGLEPLAFRALLALAPLESRGLSDDLVARRRALREASPDFFRYYMEIVRRGR